MNEKYDPQELPSSKDEKSKEILQSKKGNKLCISKSWSNYMQAWVKDENKKREEKANDREYIDLGNKEDGKVKVVINKSMLDYNRVLGECTYFMRNLKELSTAIQEAYAQLEQMADEYRGEDFEEIADKFMKEFNIERFAPIGEIREISWRIKENKVTIQFDKNGNERFLI